VVVYQVLHCFSLIILQPVISSGVCSPSSFVIAHIILLFCFVVDSYYNLYHLTVLLFVFVKLYSNKSYIYIYKSTTK